MLTVGSTIFGLWWLFLKPVPDPEITSFEATERTYKFGQEIALNWQISYPKHLENLTLIAQNTQGEKALDNRVFVKTQLKDDPNCRYEENLLSCQNIPTGATEPENYKFILTVNARKGFKTQEITSKESEVIRLETPPVPTISQIGSQETQYMLPAEVNLKFQLSHAEQVKELKVFKNGAIFKQISFNDLSKYCQQQEENHQNCQLSIPLNKPGNYLFSLEAVPKENKYVQSQGIVDAKTPITVTESTIPLVINSFKINGNTSSPIQLKYQELATITWQVTGKNVRVNLTGVSEDLSPKVAKPSPPNNCPRDNFLKSS